MLITNERMGWVSHTVAIGTDQLVYIQEATSGNTSTMAAKTYVHGTLDGRVTIASEDDIMITDHIRYANTSSTSDDALGLISKDDVWVTTAAPDNLDVYAAILAAGQYESDRGSFGVLEYYSGSPRGDLHVYGSIVQDQRGAVGTFSETSGPVSGYTKQYTFDSRFSAVAPPYYPTVNSKVRFNGWSEGPTA